jgi:hypothetical protein
MQDGRPVAYRSKKFSPAEVNYTTGEQELLGIIQALDEWRCYLEGSEMVLVTDHKPITYLDTQPHLSRRQARWVEKLARFNYTWKYRPGRVNVADPLSRSPALQLSIALCVAQLCVSTRSKASKRATSKARKAGTRAQVPQLLTEQILQAYADDDYFAGKASDEGLQQTSEGYWLQGQRIVVPNAGTLRQGIIRDMHNAPLAGHVGMQKTLQAVSRVFWWPGLRRDVKEYVNNCHACQTNKASNQRPAGLLQPLPIPERRWECVTMDLITSLPETPTGLDAVAVFVDKLSKMVHFAACKTAISAEEFAELYIQHVVRHHGISKVLISDRDPRFTSKFLTAVCQQLQIKQGLSTAFHPQTDGQTERANRTLEDMLRHYISPNQTDWDKQLAAAEFAVNNSWHPATRNTPFFLNYGQHPLTPVTIGTESVVPSATAFVHALEEHIQEAKLCLKQAQDRQKAYADQHRRDVQFAAGDQVLLSTKNIRLQKGKDMTRKLMPKWIGPFKVLQTVGPVAARLELPPHLRMHNVFHVSLLKAYRDDGSVKPPPPLGFMDGDPVFKVDRLLDTRIRKRGTRKVTEYLVAWEGYSAAHNTWEPAYKILDKKLIADFKASRQA